MIERDVYREMIDQASADLRGEIASMTDELLAQRPGANLNPVGFIYFHVLRSWDRDLNHLILGQDQHDDAWHRGGFAAESDFEPSGTGLSGAGTGMGYSNAEVDAVPKGKALLGRYHDQLFQETLAYLDGSSGSTRFDEALENPLSPTNPFTPRWRLQHLIRHTCKHLGDIQFVKGMLGIPDPTYPPH
jgi:hypothetical protein